MAQTLTTMFGAYRKLDYTGFLSEVLDGYKPAQVLRKPVNNDPMSNRYPTERPAGDAPEHQHPARPRNTLGHNPWKGPRP